MNKKIDGNEIAYINNPMIGDETKSKAPVKGEKKLKKIAANALKTAGAAIETVKGQLSKRVTKTKATKSEDIKLYNSLVRELKEMKKSLQSLEVSIKRNKMSMNKLIEEEAKLPQDNEEINNQIIKLKQDIKGLKNQGSDDAHLATIKQKQKELSKRIEIKDRSSEIKSEKSILTRFRKQYEKELKTKTAEFKRKYAQAQNQAQKIKLKSKASRNLLE